MTSAGSRQNQRSRTSRSDNLSVERWDVNPATDRGILYLVLFARLD